MANMENYICDMYYFERLKEIECGLPVRRLSIFIGPYNESFDYTGANTGLYNVAEIEDLIDRFGRPIDIDFGSLDLQNEWEEWLSFINNENFTYQELQDLKQAIDAEILLNRPGIMYGKWE